MQTQNELPFGSFTNESITFRSLAQSGFDPSSSLSYSSKKHRKCENNKTKIVTNFFFIKSCLWSKKCNYEQLRTPFLYVRAKVEKNIVFFLLESPTKKNFESRDRRFQKLFFIFIFLQLKIKKKITKYNLCMNTFVDIDFIGKSTEICQPFL